LLSKNIGLGALLLQNCKKPDHIRTQWLHQHCHHLFRTDLCARLVERMEPLCLWDLNESKSTSTPLNAGGDEIHALVFFPPNRYWLCRLATSSSIIIFDFGRKKSKVDELKPRIPGSWQEEQRRAQSVLAWHGGGGMVRPCLLGTLTTSFGLGVLCRGAIRSLSIWGSWFTGGFGGPFAISCRLASCTPKQWHNRSSNEKIETSNAHDGSIVKHNHLQHFYRSALDNSAFILTVSSS